MPIGPRKRAGMASDIADGEGPGVSGGARLKLGDGAGGRIKGIMGGGDITLLLRECKSGLGVGLLGMLAGMTTVGTTTGGTAGLGRGDVGDRWGAVATFASSISLRLALQ